MRGSHDRPLAPGIITLLCQTSFSFFTAFFSKALTASGNVRQNNFVLNIKAVYDKFNILEKLARNLLAGKKMCFARNV